MGKKTHLILLGFIFLVGIWFRTSGTLQGNFAFTYDQGRDFLVLKDLVSSHKLSLIGPTTGIDGVFHGVWWYWLTAPLFLFTSGNVQNAILLFNIISATPIILAFWLGKQIKNETLGLLLAGLVAAIPYFISTSAQFWNPNVLPGLVLLFYLLLSLKISQIGKAFGVGLVLGAIFEFAVGSGALVIIAVILGFGILKTKVNLRQAVFAAGGFTFWLMPRLIFEARHDFIQLNSFIKYITAENSTYSIQLVPNIISRLHTFWSMFKNSYGMNSWLLGWALVGLILFYFIIRIRQLKWSKIPYVVYLSMILPLIMMFEAVLYPGILWDYYLIAWPTLLLPFMGWLMWDLIHVNKFLGGALLLTIAIIGFWPGKFLIKDWAGDASVYKNQIQVVERIYTDAAGQKYNLEVFSPSVIDYNYQYLFAWFGNSRFGYLPERKQVLPLVYYIIEPDAWNKGLREKWIKDRLHDGQVSWEDELRSGIVVQKRMRNLKPAE